MCVCVKERKRERERERERERVRVTFCPLVALSIQMTSRKSGDRVKSKKNKTADVKMSNLTLSKCRKLPLSISPTSKM